MPTWTLPDLTANAGLKDRRPTLAGTRTSGTLRKSQELHILFYDRVDASSAAIQAKAVENGHVDVAVLGTSSHKVTLKLDRQYPNDLATIDEIRGIEDAREWVLYKKFARDIIKANVTINATAYQGCG